VVGVEEHPWAVEVVTVVVEEVAAWADGHAGRAIGIAEAVPITTSQTE